MLEDVPEMGYRSTDVEHEGSPVRGRGEICFRGPNVFVGYYKMPEKTSDTVDAQGWCHTGDIGVWTPNGKLRIVDRKKNIFKLAQGEYVAAEKIENIISQSPFVAQSFVYGDSLRSTLVAIIVADVEQLEPWAAKHAKGAPVNQLCTDSRVVAAVQADITARCKSAGLKGFETPKAIAIIIEPFSVENGMLTPTFKLKRPQARDYFKDTINSLYASIDANNSGTKSKL